MSTPQHTRATSTDTKQQYVAALTTASDEQRQQDTSASEKEAADDDTPIELSLSERRNSIRWLTWKLRRVTAAKGDEAAAMSNFRATHDKVARNWDYPRKPEHSSQDAADKLQYLEESVQQGWTSDTSSEAGNMMAMHALIVCNEWKLKMQVEGPRSEADEDERREFVELSREIGELRRLARELLGSDCQQVVSY